MASAAAAAVGTRGTVTVTDSDENDNMTSTQGPIELNTGFTGVMARYLASIELAGKDLETPPEDQLIDTAAQRQPCRLRSSSRDGSAAEALHSPRGHRHQSSQEERQEAPRKRKPKSKMSCNAPHTVAVNSPETLRRHRLLAAQLNHIHTGGASASDDDSGCGVEEFTWVPAGLSHAQVHQYMRSIPGYAVPLVGTAGDRNRIRRLLRQLPPHDNEACYCHVTLGDVEQRELALFCQRRKREALGRGEVRPLAASNNPVKCIQCDGVILGGDLAVSAQRAGPAVFWHPQCFVCAVCCDLLVDLIYFHGAATGLVYCGRHHAETLKPRCAACDEIIFSDECTEAEGLSWHMEHFTCAECHTFLGGQRYVVRGAGTLELASGSCDRPPSVYCCDCYERCHADRCMSCSRPIKVDEGHMAHSGLHWHATDTCFSCDKCHRSLIGYSFVPQNGAVYCAACANESNSFARDRHYESNDAISESSNDFTISHQVATITQHLVQPCSPGGSYSGYLGGDETTRRYSGQTIPEGRSKVVSRGMASRYLDESSDCSDEAAHDQTQKIHPRRNSAKQLLRNHENDPSGAETRNDRHKLTAVHHHQHQRALGSPSNNIRQLPDWRQTNCMTSSHSVLLHGNDYEEFEYADDEETFGLGPAGSTRENISEGVQREVLAEDQAVINTSVGVRSPEAGESADEHKYYDVIEVKCGLNDESRDNGIGRRAGVTGSSQFVSESVRRYLEQAEAWDCHSRGRSGRRSTCSTCSSSSSDSSEFDYYLDRPSTADDVMNWGSGNRLLEQHKTSGACTKQCVVS